MYIVLHLETIHTLSIPSYMVNIDPVMDYGALRMPNLAPDEARNPNTYM